MTGETGEEIEGAVLRARRYLYFDPTAQMSSFWGKRGAEEIRTVGPADR